MNKFLSSIFLSLTPMTLSAMKSWFSGYFTSQIVFVRKIDQQWDADLMDMTKVAKYNDGYHYILLATDIFSCHVWTVPLRDKEYQKSSDTGTEFLGHKVQNLFKLHLIHHFVTQNEVKANYAERTIKTIKGEIYKYFIYKQSYHYIDALQDITRAYNSSVHRSIKMAPAQVTMSKLNQKE